MFYVHTGLGGLRRSFKGQGFLGIWSMCFIFRMIEAGLCVILVGVVYSITILRLRKFLLIGSSPHLEIS